ncbi:hypothetical protein SGCZBJ_12530 [Caulobacter zeae]|uniref:Uncharacterized protein n=2 Tax=Caulobacter zeae TaxID=2055137 RepID=A0A2N5DGD5_9CAUL|nr:hypothetical protein SGCZBJ_12530 [Caulobacter zeae]
MAVGGACLYGLYLFAIRLRSGATITFRDGLLVLANLAGAAASGLILTAVFAGRLVALIPWPTLQDAGLIAFAFGVFGWELLPLLFPKALRWAEGQADRLGGG